jgi:phage-related minor tail protein
MEKATGQAIGKTVEQFKELARSPADAAAKLNEQYNFLTASIYLQIKALEDQGRAMDAANLAERTYADALKTRAQSVVDNAGIIEKAWRGITGAAKSAWDAMLGIGRRCPTPSRSPSCSATCRTSGAQPLAGHRRRERRQQGHADIKDQINLLAENERMERRLAESQAARAQITRQTIEWEKQGDQFLTKQQQREKELTKAKVEGQALVNAGVITEQQLVERLNGIRQKYNETTGQSEVAGIVARTKELQAVPGQAQGAGASGNYAEDVKPTAGEQLVAKAAEGAAGHHHGCRARREGTRARRGQVAGRGREAGHRPGAPEQGRQAESIQLLRKQAESRGQAGRRDPPAGEGQEAANATFGKSKTAIEEMTLAQLKHTAAQMEATETAIRSTSPA